MPDLSTTSLLTNFSRPCRLLAAVIACLCVIATPLLAQQAPVLVTQPVDNSVRTVLPGNIHPLARAEFDQGEAPPDLVLHRMLLVLKRSDQQETALRRLIENQQYKKSPSYHQWLTPEEFGAQFGPADSDMAAVTNWMTASGFQIAQVSKGRIVIEFDGTAGQVKQAFGTAIHKFVVKGEEHWANVNNPSIPTALVPVVAGVDSLHNFLKKAQNHHVGAYSEASKQVTSPDFNTTLYGLTWDAVAPYDFATIYDLLPLWNATPAINGTGVTIGIVGRTDIHPSDATTFWSLFGLDGTHAPQPTLTITTNGPDPGFTGDEPEADIDTQWSGAAAPGATINFVTSASTETTDGVDLSAVYIVDNNLAPVMSESYGLCENVLGGGAGFYSAVWEEASAQGISAMVSTGDNGSAGCDASSYFNAASAGLNVNGLASSQFNVAVGGTDFNQPTAALQAQYWNTTNALITQESAKGPIPETTWNASCTNALFVTQGFGLNAEEACNNSTLFNQGWVDTVGGSGGSSVDWSKPAWQTGTPNDNARDLPDVSLFASSGFLGSFYVICQMDTTNNVCDLSGNMQGYGGTSVASPAFAGIMALVNQKWGMQGNPNFVLYKLVAKQPSAFHDIPSGSTIAMPCFTGTANCITNVGTDQFGVLSDYSTATGYDLATGLGSVDAAQLVNHWHDVSFTPSMTSLTLNSGTAVNVVHGTAVPVVVTVTPASPHATGDVSLLVSPVPPGKPSIDIWPLTNGTTSNWKTSLLPGGTYSVVAHYQGDATYGGSNSSPAVSVTVSPESSSVYMPGVVTGTDVNNNPVYSTSVVYGSIYLPFPGIFYALRADVLNAGGNYCTTSILGEVACPTGTVTFTDNGNALDASPYTLNSLGYTEDQAIQLTVGSHTLVGKYTPAPTDLSYNASTSPSTVVTVTKATSAINVLASPSSVVTNQQFTVTATLTTTTSSYGAAPTGTVSFFANGTPLSGQPGGVQYTPVTGSFNSGTLASLGASLTTSIPTAGNYNITATYSGDGNYTTVTTINSAPIVVTNPAPDFTPAVNATPNTALANQTVPWNGTLTAVNGYNKPVTLSCTAGAPGTCTFNPSTPITPTAAGASFTVTVGSNTAATYNFNIQATDGTITHTQAVSLTVNPDFSLATTLTPPPAASPGQSTHTMMALAPVGAGTFTNNVTYACSGLPAGATCSFNPAQINSGQAGQSVTVTVQTAGPFTGSLAQPARSRLRAQKQPLWLPLSLPLAGMVLVGLVGRRLPRRYKILGLCMALTLAGFLVACGGGSSSSTPPAVVTVSPGMVNTLYPSLPGAPAQTQQFSASVSNTTSQSVTWAVTGGSANGTIDQTGLYTAPAALPSPASVSVTATSAAATSPGTATVNLQTPTPAGTTPMVMVTVTEGALQHTTTFALTVN